MIVTPGKTILLIRLLAIFLITVGLGIGMPPIRAAEPVNAANAKLEPVVLQLKWYHQFQFAGYYAAIEKGYYQAAGLEVRFADYKMEMDLVKPVLTGEANFSLAGSEVVLQRLLQRPVVVLAALFQHSPIIVMTLRDSGLRTPQDLIGKRLMWSNTAEIAIPTMFRLEGIPIDRIQLQTSSWNIDDLINGNTDALSGYVTNQPFLFQQRNIPLTIIYPHHYGADFYGDCLITSEAEIEKHPERVARFRTASLKGWEYAMKHPEEIITVILEKYGSQRTREHLRFEAEAMKALILPDLVEIGHMNPGRWQTIAQQYARFDALPADYSLNGFLYDPNRPAGMIMSPMVSRMLIMLGLFILMMVTMLLIFNRSLRKMVGQRTTELTLTNRNLVREIEERRRTEEQLRMAKEEAEAANHAKSEFLARMSHELRTPLNAVIGFAEVLTHQFWGPLNEKQQEFVKDIHESGSHLLSLINEVLDLAKIEAGKIILEPTSFDLGEALESSLAFIQPQAEKKGVTTQTRIPEPLRTVSLTADKRRFQQILFNLLSNAVKFTPAQGRVILGVEAGESEHRIFVEDTGVGIEKGDQARIFESFYQVKHPELTKIEGTGLGLAVVRQLVELHGGRLWVESAGSGKGSTFYFTLPFAKV